MNNNFYEEFIHIDGTGINFVNGGIYRTSI